MGLTIHYQLTASLTDPKDVRPVMEGIRQFARDLPFQSVGDFLEWEGAAADFDRCERHDPHRWLKIQASHYVKNGNVSICVKPVHFIGFTTFPGDGSEPANFGLCRYPAAICVPVSGSRSMRIRTDLSGWRWRSFCKTQYASNPKCGGVKNFLKCHLSIVKLLDFVQHTKLVAVDVHDEGEYWQHRNVEQLAREVGDWNEFIAAIGGTIKDSASADGLSVDMAIADFADFEHLEARGMERLEKLQKDARN